MKTLQPPISVPLPMNIDTASATAFTSDACRQLLEALPSWDATRLLGQIAYVERAIASLKGLCNEATINASNANFVNLLRGTINK